MSTTTTTRSFRIRQATLKQGLASVVHAMDVESMRYALAGVRVVIMPGEITFVATDGRRLAHRRFELDHDLDPCQFTIPRKAALELSRIYSDKGFATVSVDVDSVNVSWRNGRRQSKVTSFQPLEGRYPKWQDIVTGLNERNWQGEISGPADMISPLFEPRQGIDLRVNGRIESYSQAIALDCRGITTRNKKSREVKHDGAFDIRIDPSYFAEFLAACGDSLVTIRVEDEHNPAYLQSENGLREIIMPISRER